MTDSRRNRQKDSQTNKPSKDQQRSERVKSEPKRQCKQSFAQLLVTSLQQLKAELAQWQLEDYQCLLCQSPLQQHASVPFLCPSCVNRLPRAKHSCIQCAEPLATTANPIKRTADNPHIKPPVESTPASSLCQRCQAKPPDFDATFYSYLYTRPIDHWISQVKDRHQLSWLLKLCRLMQEHTPDISSLDIDAITYIPGDPWRTLKRGMNPGEEFARYQAQQLELPILKDILQKTSSIEVKQLPANARQAASQSSLSIEKINLEGRHLLLIDDVMTTGETANAAAKLLKSRGAARVYVWVLARTPAPDYLNMFEH